MSAFRTPFYDNVSGSLGIDVGDPDTLPAPKAVMPDIHEMSALA